MADVIWSPRSLRDFDEICEYIAKDSPQYARVFARRALALIEYIPDHPFAGSIVPEYDLNELRERFLYSYRFIYRIRAERIELVTICHGARLLPSQLD
jgi:plasmid stabilization system protein ParE